MKAGVDYVGIYVVSVCHDGEGNVLYTHRSSKARDEQEKWNIGAGGTLEVGESLHECLLRELKEETGADAKEIEYLGHREIFREKGEVKTHWIGHYYKVLVDKDEVRVMEESCDGILWQSFHNHPSPMITKHDEVYELFKHHF